MNKKDDKDIKIGFELPCPTGEHDGIGELAVAITRLGRNIENGLTAIADALRERPRRCSHGTDTARGSDE